MSHYVYLWELIFCLITTFNRQKIHLPHKTLRTTSYTTNIIIMISLEVVAATSADYCFNDHLNIRVPKIGQSYKPSWLDTCSLFSIESSMYPSFAVSDFHLPWRLNNLSGIPALAALVAPPARKL